MTSIYEFFLICHKEYSVAFLPVRLVMHAQASRHLGLTAGHVIHPKFGAPDPSRSPFGSIPKGATMFFTNTSRRDPDRDAGWIGFLLCMCSAVLTVSTIAIAVHHLLG